jgi:hypothetical protein
MPEAEYEFGEPCLSTEFTPNKGPTSESEPRQLVG